MRSRLIFEATALKMAASMPPIATPDSDRVGRTDSVTNPSTIPAQLNVVINDGDQI